MRKQEGISAEAKDLVCSLIKKKPSERPTATEALKHEWFDKKFEEKSSVILGSAQHRLIQRSQLKRSNPEQFMT